jgi:dihydrofolate reductase
MIISLIVAADELNGIGKNNDLLCHLPADLKYFKQTTSGHHIAMGRKTYESIGRPLPNRTNIIISRDENYKAEGCITVNSLANAIQQAETNHETELFITGGGTIYEQALPLAHRVYLTRIHAKLDADTFFPALSPAEWKLTTESKNVADEKNPYAYSFQVYERIT